MTRATSAVCERARKYVSLQLDNELSQLEDAMLQAHLGRCEPCRAYAADVAATTRELRAAEPERLVRPIALPRRRRVSFGNVQAAAAAAIALAAVGIGGLLGGVGTDRTEHARAAGSHSAYLKSPEYELRLLEGYHGTWVTDGIELIV